MSEPTPKGATRREFLATAAAGAALAAGLSLTQNVHAAGTDEIKVGVIGCGGRGRGAADNVLHAAKGVKIVAIGDIFPSSIDAFKNEILGKTLNTKEVKELGNSADVPNNRIFLGLDAFQKVLDCDINYVILATPPGFRPFHLEAAVKKGVNIFTEKPVGTDTTGLRKVFGLVEESKTKNLGIAAGTQRRHQKHYLEGLKRIKDGEIGEIVGGRCWWNQGILWQRDREKDMSDAKYQIHNWYNFVWTCGDHIVEQHVHNIDVMNWVMGGPPLAVISMGYKTRTDPRYHNIYDFFANNFEYPNGVQVVSQCRHISGTWTKNAEEVLGTKGLAQLSGDRPKILTIKGKPIFTKEELDSHIDPYVQEHTDLIESIRKGQPINELKTVAESTLTAIIGRMSAYSGQRVEFKWALDNSKENLFPKELTLESSLPEPALPIPGQYKLV